MPVIWSMVAATALPNVGGWLGGIAFYRKKETWYQELKKPSWTPPDYVYGPVWTGLYTSMGFASYLVWRDGGGFDGDARLPLALYGGQLALNWIWPTIFFGCGSVKWALVDLMLLGVGSAACAVSFNPINKTASLLLLPYIGWLGLATSITYYLYQNNSKKD